MTCILALGVIMTVFHIAVAVYGMITAEKEFRHDG